MNPTPLQITSFLAHHGRVEPRVRWPVVAATIINLALWAGIGLALWECAK